MLCSLGGVCSPPSHVSAPTLQAKLVPISLKSCGEAIEDSLPDWPTRARGRGPSRQQSAPTGSPGPPRGLRGEIPRAYSACTFFAAAQQNPTLSRALRTCRRPGGGSHPLGHDPRRCIEGRCRGNLARSWCGIRTAARAGPQGRCGYIRRKRSLLWAGPYESTAPAT